MFDVRRMPIIASQVACKARLNARLAVLKAEGAPMVRTLANEHAEPITRHAEPVGPALRTPWPGLKPLTAPHVTLPWH